MPRLFLLHERFICVLSVVRPFRCLYLQYNVSRSNSLLHHSWACYIFSLASTVNYRVVYPAQLFKVLYSVINYT